MIKESEFSQNDAATQFYRLARNRPVIFPSDWSPSSFSDGLALQLKVLELWERDGFHLGGWKVGLTSGNGRSRVPEDYRPFGYILQERIFGSGDTLALREFAECEIEPELCVIIDQPLRGEVSVAQVREAVRAVVPSWEINDGRTPGRPLPFRFADDLGQWGIVVGDPVTADAVDFPRLRVVVERDGALVSESTPADTPDDPFLSISRLCHRLAEFNRGLEPGLRVITGSFAHHKPTPANRWTARFGDLGEVSVCFVS